MALDFQVYRAEVFIPVQTCTEYCVKYAKFYINVIVVKLKISSLSL